MSKKKSTTNKTQAQPAIGHMTMFTPKPTPAENLAASQSWFDKAVKYEAAGRPASLIDKCLDLACAYEDAAQPLAAA